MKYPRPPFDIAEEVIKMHKYTNLPVTDIMFDNPALEFEMNEANDYRPTEAAGIYINDTMIGTMDYIFFPGIIGCDTATQDRLDWVKIYEICAPDIFPLIQELEPRAHTVKPIRYHVVSAFDIDGTELTHVNCYYSDQWHVILMGLNYVERSASVQVKLTPPPPRDL